MMSDGTDLRSPASASRPCSTACSRSPFLAATTPRVICASAMRMGLRSVPVKVGGRADDLSCVDPGGVVLANGAIAVHGVEVELGWVDYEVVIHVVLRYPGASCP